MAHSFGSKQQAELAALKLVRKLRGKGWKPHVWKNIEWYAAAENKNIVVYVQEDGYSCLMNDHSKHTHSGSCLWTHKDNSGKDPNVLVLNQVSLAANVVEKLCKVVDETSVACGLQAQFEKKDKQQAALDDFIRKIESSFKLLKKAKKKCAI